MHNNHDASITLMDNGKIIYHIELERVFNEKHIIGSNNLCMNYLRYNLLPKLGITFDEIDTFCLSSIYHSAYDQFYFKGHDFETIISDKKWLDYPRKPYLAWEDEWEGKKRTFFSSCHHINHLAAAYYTSPFSDSLVFSCDGIGDMNCSTAYGDGDHESLTLKDDFTSHPNRFGLYYQALGFVLPFLGTNHLSIPGKAMALASYGKPQEKWKPIIRKYVLSDNFKPKEFGNEIGLHKLDSYQQEAHDFLATFQACMEEYMLDEINKIRKSNKNLCLSGGCALNVLLNSKLENVYIPPICNDSGQSLGCLLYYWHHILKNPFYGNKTFTPYLGEYVENCELLKGKTIETEEIVDLLINGKIIGWVQDRSEIGPRALGNRSILCRPDISGIKDKLNKIKQREWWRPFAPICLEEKADEWFETQEKSYPYMLKAVKVKKYLEGICHIDNTARLQTINSSQNHKLYNLLKLFYEKTGIPILINTSLNEKGKPIVNNLQSILNINKRLDGTVIDNQFITNTKLF